MLQRLKHDFHLLMITLVGLIASSALVPYAVYRFITGNYLVALADSLMIVASVLCALVAWRTGETEKPGLWMACFFCVGAVLVCVNLGQDSLFWIYPLMVFIFFLVAPLKALILLLVMVISIVSLYFSGFADIFANKLQLLAFITTTFITSIFAYIFAYRSRIQRKELRRLATTDPLTGATNRHSLIDELTDAIEQFQQHGVSSGLMLLDLDHFKSINDNFGHQTGDQILRQLVPLLKQMIRQQDAVFRYGGEEFVLLIREIQLTDLHHLAEEIRHAIWHKLSLPDGSALTTSIGICAVQQAQDWGSWLQHTDMALYQAKHNGRNQVVLATDEPELISRPT